MGRDRQRSPGVWSKDSVGAAGGSFDLAGRLNHQVIAGLSLKSLFLGHFGDLFIAFA